MVKIKGIIRKEKDGKLFIETADGDTFLLRKSTVTVIEGKTVEFDDKDIEKIWRLPPDHPDEGLPPDHPDEEMMN